MKQAESLQRVSEFDKNEKAKYDLNLTYSYEKFSNY